MNLNARIILRTREFFRKHGRIILIIFIIWLVIFLANLYLKLRPKEINISKSYNPNNPVMDEGESIPNRLKKTINDKIQEYFDFCNNKEYENAFNMLTDECKEYIYNNDIEEFKLYIDNIFNNKKIYNLQNYSNVDDIYIYNIKILDDVTANGATEEYTVYQDKISLHYNKDNIKISNQGYIGSKEINKETENDDMKVKVIKKEMSYYREEYTLEIRNKTDGYIMISDDLGSDQVTLNLGDQTRVALNTVNSNIVVLPGETSQITLLFDKYYDDKVNPKEIKFNNVRFLSAISSKNLNGENTENIYKSYSMNIAL